MKILFTTLLISVFSLCFAQNEIKLDKTKAVQVAITGEFLGSFYAGFGVKIEPIFNLGSYVAIAPKIGAGFNIMYGLAPIAILGGSVMVGEGNHKIALGSNYVTAHNIGIASLEYRFYSSKSNFAFYIGAHVEYPYIIVIPGASIGFKF